jgi:lipopolysaccharide/colanic/teichoic acid biosynthesis glycosyltransferase
MERDLGFSETVPRTGVQASTERYRWSRSTGKRLFDLIVAGFLFLVSQPLMLAAALAIKCSSPGPIFFRQVRVGKDGRTFSLLKFRTMNHGNAGPGLTRQGDPRIFPVGRLLRKWKLDELPQFLNVMKGDMSLVGPRPDLPEYLAVLEDAQREIFWIRPGITGSATLKFRHEEALLAQVPPEELRHFYISQVLPEKVQMDLEYGAKATFFSDAQILLRTLASIVS